MASLQPVTKRGAQGSRSRGAPARALEARVMLDAAALATFWDAAGGDDAAAPASLISDHEGEAEAPLDAGGDPTASREIVFIDPGIADWRLLLLDLPEGVEVVLLDPARDGIAQMAEHLADRADLAAIHVISHGAQASAFIGAARLDLASVDEYADALRTIGAALSENGDILFYGCDIAGGEDGAALIARIAELTGADIAASTNLTGAAALGGDWVLESATGEIEAQLVVGWDAQAAFADVLAFTAIADGGPMDGINATMTTPGVADYSADITGNGFDDFFGRNAAGTGIAFWKNNGDGSWTPLTGTDNPFRNITLSAATQFTSTNILVLDVDGDGDIDLFNLARNELWRNDGGVFTVVAAGDHALSGFSASIRSGGFVTGDFTGNGHTDIASRNADDTGVLFWQNNGNGTWTPLTDGANPFNAISFDGNLNFLANRLIVLDIDGDGWLDIYNWETEQFWRNNNGIFEVSAVNPLAGFNATAPHNNSFVTGDFSGNGFTDIVARNAAQNGLVFWRNNGGGSWTHLEDAANPFDGITIASFVTSRAQAVDANGDGTLDIYHRGLSDAVVLLQNNITAPALSSSAPAFGGSDVAPSANLVLNFSQAVNLGTGAAGTTNAVGYGDIAIYNAATNTLIERINVVTDAARIAGVGTTSITIDPVSDLPAGANVYVLIGSKAFVTAGGVHFLGINQADVFTFSVADVIPPVITNLAGDTASFTEGGAPVLIDVGGNATVTDADSANFNGGSITVAITANRVDGEDVLGIATGGAVTLSAGMTNGSTVSISGVAIGTITSNGAGANDLVITFNANATPERVTTLLRALTYVNTNDANPSEATRSVTVTIVDDTGGSVAATSFVTVTAVNDAPVITGGATHALTGTDENTTSGATTVSTILTGVGFSDVDGPGSGIAVTGITGNGTWQFNAGSGWVSFGTPSNAASLLLSATTQVRYVPDGANGETATFSFRAWDTSSGTASAATASTADTTSHGGTTAFSAQTASASITVTDVNDAPVLGPATLALAPILEDAPAPTNGSLAGATQISTLLGSVTDVDNGALRGAAITAVGGGGTLWYSLDAGATWTQAPALGGASALLLRDTDHIYYQPALDVNGTIAAAITFRAWDQTSGTAGNTADTTTSGGTTAFSAATGSASVDITPVNDAPVLVSGGALAPVNEDTANPAGAALSSLVDANDDKDGGTIPGFAVVGNAAGAGQGVWQYSTDAGANWFDIGVVGDGANALALSAGTLVRFLPTANFNGAPEPLTVRAVDESWAGGFTAGATRVTIDTTTTGGETAISAATGDITTTIIAVNDLPVLSGLVGGATFIEGGAAVVIDSTVSVSDVELDAANGGQGNYAGASLSIARQGGANAQDVFSVIQGGSLTITGGDVLAGGNVIAVVTNPVAGQMTVTFENNGTIPTRALVIEVMRAIAYSNASDDPPGSVTLSWTFSDGNSGDAQGIGANPGTTSATAVVNITPVNDPPTLTATASNPTFTEKGAPAALFSGVTISTIEAGQTITGMTLTVANLADDTAEVLRIDGVTLALVDGASAALTSGTASVTVVGSTATVTITGASLTAAQAQTLVGGLAYENTSNNPTVAGGRVVTLTSVTDSGGTANGGSDTTALSIASSVTLVAVNDAPVITGLDGDTVQTVSGGSPSAIDLGGNAVVSDVDSVSFNGGSLTITQTGGTANGSFALQGDQAQSNGDGAIAAGQTITVGGVAIGVVDAVADGQGGSGLVIAFNADATPERVTLLVRELLYGASGIGTRNFSMTVSDGEDVSAVAAFTVEVTPNPPVITGLDGDAVTYTEGAAPVLLDLGGNAVVTDADSANFDGGELRVAITGGGVPGEDVLSIQPSASVSLVGPTVNVGGVEIGTFSGGTAGADLVVTFNADATPARVTDLVRALAYSNSNDAAPSTADRTIAVTIRDTAAGAGSATSTAAAITVSVVAVNDAPTVDAPATVTVTEDVAGAVTGIVFADVDAGGAAVVTTFSVPSGTLTATSGGGVTVAGSGTGTLTLTGTIADINAFVAGSNLLFTTAQDATADVTLTITINDQGNTGTGGAQTAQTTLTIEVIAVNDAPVLTLPATISVTEDVASPLTGIVVADVDAGTGTMTLTLSVPSGTLAATAGSGVTVAGSGSGTLVLTGTLANLNAFIAASGITFTTAANATADVTLTVVVNDGGNTGIGGALTDTGAITLTVIAVNDAPTVTAPATVLVTEDVPGPITGIVFADVDAGTAPVLATFTVPSGTLTATVGGGVSVTGSGTGTLTLTGTIADINAFVAGSNLLFTTAQDATADVTLTITINDQGNTGTGGAQTAQTTLTIEVIPVNDAPRVVNLIPAQNATTGLPFSFAIPGNTFFDPDIGDVMTLSVTLPNGAPLPLWLSFNPATGTLAGTPPPEFASEGVELLLSVRATDRDGEFATTPLLLRVLPDDGAGDVNFRLGAGGASLPQGFGSQGPGPSNLPEQNSQSLSSSTFQSFLRGFAPGTSLAQIFQGSLQLNAQPDFTPDRGSDGEGEDAPTLVFQNGRWFVIDPNAEGGLRPQNPSEALDEPPEDAPEDSTSEEDAGAEAFSRQLLTVADAFDQRAAALDLALSTHDQIVSR